LGQTLTKDAYACKNFEFSNNSPMTNPKKPSPNLDLLNRVDRERINGAVLSGAEGDEEQIQAALEALDKVYSDAMARQRLAAESEREFQALPYEMSEDDLGRLRDHLTDYRLGIMRVTGKLPTNMSGTREKPRFKLRPPGEEVEMDFELFAASYAHGKAFLLAHPEHNGGWGCAIAIGWESREGIAEGNRIDFSDYPDVLLSVFPLMEKYGAKDPA
jgi:hypothetical protein